ncbi:unnamed protein product [Caenorhabditis nigoni]
MNCLKSKPTEPNVEIKDTLGYEFDKMPIHFVAIRNRLIDVTFSENQAKYVNHSCDPNLKNGNCAERQKTSR